MAAKTNPGNAFEDFRLGQRFRHATPRTVTAGDVALYTALYGSRFAVQSSDAFAEKLGYPCAPVDDLLVFHIIFGKTVPDISLNAIANLGYAECRFLAPVFPGDTLTAVSEVIGLKENSNRESGVVYVRTRGSNQHGQPVLEYVRWVMVRKRDNSASAPTPHVPELAERVDPQSLSLAVPRFSPDQYDLALAGSPHTLSTYSASERIDHVDGFTIEEAEHQLATRLYQNTARVHFDRHIASQGRHGQRLVYGGVVMSIVRALSFNGLANAFHIAAINGGRHVAPCFAGDTIYAWSEILDTATIASRSDVGALRVRITGVKNAAATDWPRVDAQGKYLSSVVLELDLWLLIPRNS